MFFRKAGKGKSILIVSKFISYIVFGKIQIIYLEKWLKQSDWKTIPFSNVFLNFLAQKPR
jgi:hypothetical protein